MILETAILDVKPGQTAAFEATFAQAGPIIARAKGYRGHELQRCLETRTAISSWSVGTVWKTIPRGFRKSADYQDWKRLLHHFYDPFPTVEHYEPL